MEASKRPAFLARWRSIRVMYLSMFFSSLGFTIVLASLWPFLLMVAGKGATPSLLGYIVAAFSLGQLVASPLIGYWSNRHGSKIPLLVALTINVIGNFMYSYSDAIPNHDVKNAWFMMGSRFLVGIGAAITGVTRAYISGATSSNERTPAMANMSMAQALGFVLGPALALVFVPIGETGLQWKAIDLELNMYTGPGFLSGLLALINVICLLTLFVDYRLPTSQLTESQKNPINADDAEALIQMSEGKPPDKVGVTMCIILFFVVMFVFTVFETIASPLLMDEYAWTRKEATLYVGILFAVSGIQAIVVFLIVKPLAHRFGEIFMLGASLCFILTGFFILLPFGSKYPHIRAHLIDPPPTNSSFQAESFVTNVPAMNITRYDSRGCSYDWCFSTPLIYFEQYLAGTFLIGIGYPTSTVMIYTIYSRLLGASPQGFMMGLMASFGCLARVLGPIFVSSLYHHQGPRWMFVAVDSIVFVALLLFIGTYRRMRSDWTFGRAPCSRFERFHRARYTYKRHLSLGVVLFAVGMEASKKPAFFARWRSIRVMYLSMFFSSLGFTIVMASLWPFLLMVAGKGATPSLLGYVVAAFSLGQLIASPLIGFWSNRHGSKIPLLVTLTISVIGNVMYSYSNAIPNHDVRNAWFMIGSRFLVGIGAAITGVTRAYISGATSSSERTPAMANMSMAQALGFVLGPALALVFVPIGETGLQSKAIDLELNMYTGPGFLSGLLALVNIICLVALFVDYRLAPPQLTESTQSHKSSISADDSEALIQMSEAYSPDKVGVISSIILFFVVMFVFTVFETIVSPLLMDEYAWTRKEATLYVGILFAVSGIQAVVVFLIVKPLARRFGEIFMLGAALCFMLAGFFVILPFGDKYPPIRAHLIDPSPTNSSFQAESFATNVPGMNITRYESRGCSYDWCSSTPLIYFEQCLASTFLLGIGYPTSTVMIYTIYSKLLGASPQGFMMGLMASFGCLARVLGPIFVSSLYHHQGPRWMFVAVDSIVFVALLLFIGTHRRMRTYN